MATTTIQQRIERARADYQAFDRGDINHLMERLSEDIVWHVPGSGPLAGDRRGKQEVMDFLGEVMKVTGGTFKLELHDILASEEHVVTLARESAERNGERYEGNVVHVTHLDAQERIAEFWAIPEDQEKANRFYA